MSCDSCEYLFSKKKLEARKSNAHVENFNCDQCNFQSTDKSIVLEHMKEHLPQKANDMNTENVQMKRELTAMTDSYERLSGLYSKLKDEVNSKVFEYKKELEEAQENCRVALAENEKLRETNDIQNSLWKIWIKEHSETRSNKNTEKEKTTEEPEEAKEGEENEKLEDTMDFVRNKNRGFKKITPGAPAEAKKKTLHTGPEVTKKPSSTKTTPPPPSPPHSKSAKPSPKRYCYFWNNAENCTFINCKFLHEKAPICKFDGQCNRTR